MELNKSERAYLLNKVTQHGTRDRERDKDNDKDSNRDREREREREYLSPLHKSSTALPHTFSQFSTPYASPSNRDRDRDRLSESDDDSDRFLFKKIITHLNKGQQSGTKELTRNIIKCNQKMLSFYFSAF